MNRKTLKYRIRRVDVQVSLLTASVVTVVCACVFAFYYAITYSDMIDSLNDRVYSIYNYLENTLDKSSFSGIRIKQDQNKPSYQKMKKTLEEVKKSTGVRYLYTAAKTPEGDFIYVIDGLDAAAEDFRYPGDLIENEITGELQKALDGEVVLPRGIKDTDWGKIFISYLPIHDGDKVIGVLGIEFEAEHQFNTYRNLKLVMPPAILLAWVISAGLAVLLFRRISNPTYQDMSNTDQLTGMKNRNAFDTDMKNIMSSRVRWNYGLAVIDLNYLKKVNDRLGHESGDLYLQNAAAALREAAPPHTALYRIGGDEFAALLREADDSVMQAFQEHAAQRFHFSGQETEIDVSLAMGYALYDKVKNPDIYSTYRQADANMYKDKYGRRGEQFPAQLHSGTADTRDTKN